MKQKNEEPLLTRRDPDKGEGGANDIGAGAHGGWVAGKEVYARKAKFLAP